MLSGGFFKFFSLAVFDGTAGCQYLPGFYESRGAEF
jgi:hypothetical protein